MPDSTVQPFETATELREAHARLLSALEQQLHGASTEEQEAAALHRLESDVRQFLQRGAATGVYLEEISDRTACQVLVDYWVSALSRAGLQASGVRLARFDPVQLPDLKDKPCPYVGLEAFRSSEFFFGREADTAALIAQVRDVALVVVLGASGSGKSSIVLGGVLPAFGAGKELAQPLRVIPAFVPGIEVLESLAEAVLHGCGGDAQSAGTEAARLREDPSRLVELIGGSGAAASLIVIDQFEEVFTLSTAADREVLVASLVAFLNARREHRVVLTMREEFRSKMAELTALGAYLNDNRAWYSMRPMGYEELRAAVEKPATLVNLQFQKGILDDLVKKVLGQPAALPLLQFTLRELWHKRDRNRITWDVYRTVGDPLSALQTTADSFYGSLAPQTQGEVRRILLELVRVDELLEVYRQPVRKSRLLEAGKANTEEVLRLLETNEYIRVAQRTNDSEAIAEIRHESLIRNWPLFVDWIDEKRRDRRQRFALAQAADRWDKSGRPRQGLLTGWQLQQATELSDLLAVEREFVDASVKAIELGQRRKQLLLAGGFGFALFVIAGLWAFDHFYLQERRQTWGELDILQGMSEEDRKLYAENRLDNVAVRLWKRAANDPKSLDELVRLLKRADNLGLFKPGIYKVTEWKAYEDTTKEMSPAALESTMVTLQYPQGAAPSEAMLQYFWHKFAMWVWDEGFPIPARATVKSRDDAKTPYRVEVKGLSWVASSSDESSSVNVISKGARSASPRRADAAKRPISTAKAIPPDSALAAEAPSELAGRVLKVTSNGQDLDFTFDPSEVLLSDRDLDPAAEKLLQKYRTDWNAREPFKALNLSNWWWVPRWTLPIWKAAHAQVFPPETGAVVHAIVTIRQQPALLYSDAFVAGILQWQAISMPETVKVACESVGGTKALVDDVKKRLSDRQPLSGMVYYLQGFPDEVERRPIASKASCDLQGVWSSVHETRETASFATELEEAMGKAYDPEPPLLVYVAANLKTYLAPNGDLDESIKRRIDKQLRHDVAQSTGVSAPFVKFRTNVDLSANQYSIQIHGRPVADRFNASPGHEVDDILKKLNQVMLDNPRTWLDAEEVVRLRDTLPRRVREWLSSTYTVGELKLILERVFPERSQTSPRAIRTGSSEPRRDPSTLAHFSWLIRSLAFWKHVCTEADTRCLSDNLRRMQQARLNRSADAGDSDQPATPLPGIDLLVSGKITEASALFAQQAKAGGPPLENRFVQQYSRAVVRTEYPPLERACSPHIGKFAKYEERVGRAWVQYRINALLAEDYNEPLPKPMRRRLELCRISGLLQDGSSDSAAEATEQVERQFKAGTFDWAPDEKYWLSYLTLKGHLASSRALYKAPPPRLEAVTLLLSEVAREVPTNTAEDSLTELSGFCDKPAAGAWCLQMFMGWPTLKSDSYWIPFTLAYRLDSLSRENALKALKLADRAEQNLTAVDSANRPLQTGWVNYVRGSAHETLGEFAVPGEIDRAIQDLSDLIAPSKQWKVGEPGAWSDLLESSAGQLSVALRVKGDLDQASKAITRGDAIGKKSAMLARQAAGVSLARGKFSEALALLKDASDDDSQVLRCWSRIFSEIPQDAAGLDADVAEVAKGTHDFRDYVLLTYYWHLMRNGKEAQATELLQRRWKEINPSGAAEGSFWKERLAPERGDYMAVWREMLVGYFSGKVSKDQIAAMLGKPNEFEALPLARAPQSRDGFLTEWYFYDGLLQSVTGEKSTQVDRFKSRLQEAINMKQVAFNEYVFAKALFGRIERGEYPAR